MTTIGYGDQIPAPPPGKVVAVLIAFLGSFYMAMPLAIIGSKFEEAYKQRELEELGWDVMTIWQCELANAQALWVRIGVVAERRPEA